MTHADLVQIAARWLQGQGCSVILTELATSGETPDAIGWKGKHSILVECKTSVQDFERDKLKHFRAMPWMGAGMKRYFLTPVDLISPRILPQGWGLLEAMNLKRKPLMRIEAAQCLEHNAVHEVEILVSALRRIGQFADKGCSIKPYTFETKNTATLGVLKE